MTQMKNEQLLTEISIHDRSAATALNKGSGGLDLTALAQQLVAIAGELQNAERSGSDSQGIGDQTNQQHLANKAAARGALANREDGKLTAPSVGFHDDRNQRKDNVETARLAYTNRRARSAIFGNPELFGEPAWDILLDLFIAYGEGKPVSVSSACIGSAAPPTTGLRWLGVLAENDLVLREHDPEDQRRVLVRLTDRGLAAMDQYFASAGAPS